MSYTEMQNASGIEVGDSVKILRTASDLEQDWQCVWLEEMDNTIGMIGEVDDVNEYSGLLVTLPDGRQYHYPCFVVEKQASVVEESIELPFKKGRYYATESQMDSLRKWREDNCSSDYSAMGNIPWVVINAEGEVLHSKVSAPCLGSLLSNPSKHPFKMHKSPVVFLHIFPRFELDFGMTRAEIDEYHEYVFSFAPYANYIVHVDDKELSSDFIGIRLRDVPKNIPLMVSTHLRFPWDGYQRNEGEEYHALCREMPDITPGERLILASFLHSSDQSNRNKSNFNAGVHTGGHALWGGAAEPHVFKEYLEGEFDPRRYDMNKWVPYAGNGIGWEAACSNQLFKNKDVKPSIDAFLNAFFEGRTKTRYGETTIACMGSVKKRVETYTLLLNAIKEL